MQRPQKATNGGNMADYIVNGYAYPTISPRTLDWWMPYLTWISNFSYGFTESGQLINLEDSNLVEGAKAAGVLSLMVLTPLDEEGMFNDRVARAVMDDPAAEETLIENIEKNIIEKGLNGVDFDFEYVETEYALKYAELVSKARSRLEPQGYITTVALAPKTGRAQQGLLYQGHDYKALGEAADYSLIMTYEWGYTYGPPLPVSPINNVRRVVEYATTEIPPEKILLGMSNYGYDWTLPYERGVTKAEKLANYQAEARANYYGVPIYYDEEAQSPYFTYYAPSGTEHIVWFENQTSWQARLNLVKEYGLAGVGIWNIMTIFYGGLPERE